MGIQKDHITLMTDATTKKIDEYLEKLYYRIMDKCKDSDEAFLFVYCAGHGVADMQQYFFTNEKE